MDAAKVIVATLTPPARSTGRTHWSSRALAKKLKIGMCVDEKSQIQALDRTAPVLAMAPHLIERRSSDHGGRRVHAVLARHDDPEVASASLDLVAPPCATRTPRR